MQNRSLGDVGGTPGGLGSFGMGFVLVCLGGYFLANQVSVVGSYWSFWGGNSFGLTLVRFAGVLANMHLYFRETTLFHTLVMLVLFVAGLGLIARALGSHPKNTAP